MCCPCSPRAGGTFSAAVSRDVIRSLGRQPPATTQHPGDVHWCGGAHSRAVTQGPPAHLELSNATGEGGGLGAKR